MGQHPTASENMARKVIIDCDPGIDDAVAISMALFDPRIDVVAVTATAGNVPAEQASRNVQAIIERLDPPRFPRWVLRRSRRACAGIDNRFMHGDDGLGNQGLVVSRLHHQHPSEKVICDAVRAEPHNVTLICLGPLTNVARAFQRDPELPVLVDRLVISGGCVDGIGNVTAAAEYNMFLTPTVRGPCFDRRSPRHWCHWTSYERQVDTGFSRQVAARNDAGWSVSAQDPAVHAIGPITSGLGRRVSCCRTS